MRLYEFEAKELFRKARIPIPKAEVARWPGEAQGIAARIGCPVVLKVQILSGGRGKAGGIRFADTPEDARRIAGEMLGAKLKDMPIEYVLVEEKLDIARELYLGVTFDRVSYKVAIIASAEGGVEIEEVARRSPDAIHRISLDIDEPFRTHQGIRLAQEMGLTGPAAADLGRIAVSLFGLFMKHEAKLAEINPLVITRDGAVLAADARMSVDEDALFRHPDLTAMGVADRHEEGELTEREKWARANDIPYIDLDGDIGMFPGGAGFGILGSDLIVELGGRPANFMDSGGGPTPERLSKMLMLLQDNPNVKAIFGARFGGVSRCDDFAKGVIMFLETGKLTKPIVIRMTGNMWQEGVRIFEEARRNRPELFRNVEIHGIETPIEEIARKAVEKGRTADCGPRTAD
jgi:succinyl-CoA synthetase beta subunit